MAAPATFVGGSASRTGEATAVTSLRGAAMGRQEPLAVVGVAEPEHAVFGDLHPLHSLGAKERAVGAAEILEQPGGALEPEHGMLP